MTVDRFLKPGEGEMLKGAVHAAVCGLALVCGVYNAAAWITRRERHLGVNAVMYSALAIWEAAHVSHHTRRGLNERTAPSRVPREEIPGPRLLTPDWINSPFAGASTASHEELAS